MADRVDVLGKGRERVKALTGTTLQRELDEELQECVRAAAEETGAPIALVSLLLERTQFFRAHHGLPNDLAISRATDRDLSFCQFVVRDEATFEVNDAKGDAHLPQGLVERYGVRAYLGVPVVANDRVVGSLCVIDTVSRGFTAAERTALIELGKRASARLQFLADQRKDGGEKLLSKGVEPAFSEIRNLLIPLTAGIEFAQLMVKDLSPIAALMSSRLSESELIRSLGALRNAGISISELDQQLGEIGIASARLVKTLAALQTVTVENEPSSELDAVVRNGLELAHHGTKLVGGVEVDPVPAATLACSLSVGATLLSTVATILGSLIDGVDSPIHLTAEKTSFAANIALSTESPLDQAELASFASKLTAFALDTSEALLTSTAKGFRISFALATHASEATVSGYF